MELLTPAAFGTDARSDRVSQYMEAHNPSSKRRPLTPFERKQIEEGQNNPIFVYNVSPVHEWARNQGQLGVIAIRKRPWAEKFSDPAVVPGVTVRWARLGVTDQLQPFIESGQEIADDVCGLSPTYDVAHPNRDLSNFGVFLSKRPFVITQNVMDHLPQARQAEFRKSKEAIAEYLIPEEEQKELLSVATEKLILRLQATILEADNYFDGGPEQRKFVHHGGNLYRDSLKAFNQITGQKVTRPWTTQAAMEAMQSCEFCGSQVKPGLAKCPNCKEIIDATLYEKLKKKKGGM